MKDHFIKSSKPKTCRICNNDLTKKTWLSHWEADQHYKVNICDKCGKKNWTKVDFLGSGHDDWQPGSEY